jgi:hypothetical protein
MNTTDSTKTSTDLYSFVALSLVLALSLAFFFDQVFTYVK